MTNKMATAKGAVAIIIYMAFIASPSTSCREVDEGGVCVAESIPFVLKICKILHMFNKTQHMVYFKKKPVLTIEAGYVMIVMIPILEV